MRTEDFIFSSLLFNEEYTRKVFPHLKEDYFHSDIDRKLFELYSNYFLEYNAVPSKQAILVEIEKLKTNAGVYTSLKELVNNQASFSEQPEFLLKKTESFCKEKALYNAIKESVLIADGQDKNKNVDAIPYILQDALNVCFDTKVGHDYFNDCDARFDYYHRREFKVSTGSKKLDLITKGGWSRKTLNIFLAPPHGGKSLFMVNSAVGALNAGMNVLYISMEMAEEEIAKRFDVNFLNVDINEIEAIPKATYTSKFNTLRKKAMGTLKIREFPTGGAHVGHFKTLLQELKQKQNFTPDLIVVDYLNICQSQKYKNNASANSYTTVMSIGQELRGLAIEYNCAVLSATQTTREGAANSDVSMTNVSESFGINGIADAIMAIINSEELVKSNQIMIKQLKNRYRDLNMDNKFLLGIDRTRMRIYDLDDSGPLNTQTSRNAKPTATDFDEFNFG